jgi:RNA polymerase sigma-70 factor (ECF subfamily)
MAGLPIAEIAREAGVPPCTVKARLSRGRRALAELLAFDIPEEFRV